MVFRVPFPGDKEVDAVRRTAGDDVADISPSSLIIGKFPPTVGFAARRAVPFVAPGQRQAGGHTESCRGKLEPPIDLLPIAWVDFAAGQVGKRRPAGIAVSGLRQQHRMDDIEPACPAYLEILLRCGPVVLFLRDVSEQGPSRIAHEPVGRAVLPGEVVRMPWHDRQCAVGVCRFNQHPASRSVQACIGASDGPGPRSDGVWREPQPPRPTAVPEQRHRPSAAVRPRNLSRGLDLHIRVRGVSSMMIFPLHPIVRKVPQPRVGRRDMKQQRQGQHGRKASTHRGDL